MEMTPEQLRVLMTGAMTAALQQVQNLGLQGGGQERVGAAAAGSLQPCLLGRDKTRRYQHFRDWITQAEAKMGFLGITEGKQKIGYLRSNAGAELTTFWDKEVRARFKDITAASPTAAEAADTATDKCAHEATAAASAAAPAEFPAAAVSWAERCAAAAAPAAATTAAAEQPDVLPPTRSHQ